jgi:hypothetical protein
MTNYLTGHTPHGKVIVLPVGECFSDEQAQEIVNQFEITESFIVDTSEAVNEIINAANEDRKIQILKGLRAISPTLGLREAKDITDAIMEMGARSVIPPEPQPTFVEQLNTLIVIGGSIGKHAEMLKLLITTVKET